MVINEPRGKARFPIYVKALRVCCFFHRNEPLAGGDCNDSNFQGAYTMVYGKYLMYSLDRDKHTAKKSHELLWEGAYASLGRRVQAEEGDYHQLVTKAGDVFNII